MIAIPEGVRGAAVGIELLLLDVDGVLTDGTLYYGPDGESSKAFNVKDGLGLRLLQRAGIAVGVISARKSPALQARLRDLRIQLALVGRDDKLAALDEAMREASTEPERVAFVGDDLLDLPIMRRVGLPIAVADAHRMVRQEARWVTQLPGGRGAVREVADGLLEARGDLDRVCRELLGDVVGTGQEMGA